jgi:hypothetical protein
VHGRLDLAALTPIYSRCKTVPLVSISDGQRTPATALEESGIGLAARVCADFFHARPAHLRHGDCALHVTAGPGGNASRRSRLQPETPGIRVRTSVKCAAVASSRFRKVIRVPHALREHELIEGGRVRVSRRGKDRSTTSQAIADTFILARSCANGSPPKSPGFKCKRCTIAAGRENLRVTEEKDVVLASARRYTP